MVPSVVFALIALSLAADVPAVCKGGVDDLVSPPDDGGRRSFREAVTRDIPDFHEKREILRRLHTRNPRVVLSAALIGDAQRRADILEGRGFMPSEIELMQRRGLLTPFPGEYEHYTTLPPAHGPYVRPGVAVSSPNENGNLENAVVVWVHKETAIVAPSVDRESWLTEPTAAGIGEASPVRLAHLQWSGPLRPVPKGELYQPLSRGMEVLHTGEDGFPVVARVRRIENADEVELITKGGDLATVAMDALGLKPRGATPMHTEDFSRPIKRATAAGLTEEFSQLRFLYGREGESEEFIRRNNALIKALQRKMYAQGIWAATSSLLPSAKALSLVVYGVHPNGNNSARHYLKFMERRNVQFFTVSPVDSFRREDPPDLFDGALEWVDSSRVHIEYEAVLDILLKREAPSGVVGRTGNSVSL